MFAIDFKYYSVEVGMWCNDTFECDKSYNEFKAWLADNEVNNFEIIDIRLLTD